MTAQGLERVPGSRDAVPKGSKGKQSAIFVQLFNNKRV